ncbi:hypothetical protein JCM9140_1584 [Halalkalibacter wakoensis JCM 9140]|uniref:HTH tetR-type domain-containing protein n=1 Tax=Halalkalibacter wakoensis JCM 9140 TaxID=1236970 RepID=W4Q0S8_9BACI|nr:TetR/AcrR family transcriptional regulator [Halalkalibacter wakoensis]GAE25582.1 hypothetical protein JCM9140_1584 [Halalkalibacter wakoensis JCM 9140]
MGNTSKRALGRPPTNQQKQPTDHLILNAATSLFLKNGYKNISVDDIAATCNVTKATVYYYYSSKTELYTEAMIQLMYRIRQHMETMLSKDLPLRERLLEVATGHLKATVDIDLDHFLRETKDVLSDEQIKKMHDAEHYMHDVIEKAFNEAMDSGEITAVNPLFATQAFISLMKVGNYRNPDNTPIFPTIQESAEQLVAFFWNGLFQKN